MIYLIIIIYVFVMLDISLTLIQVFILKKWFNYTNYRAWGLEHNVYIKYLFRKFGNIIGFILSTFTTLFIITAILFFIFFYFEKDFLTNLFIFVFGMYFMVIYVHYTNIIYYYELHKFNKKWKEIK